MAISLFAHLRSLGTSKITKSGEKNTGDTTQKKMFLRVLCVFAYLCPSQQNHSLRPIQELHEDTGLGAEKGGYIVGAPTFFLQPLTFL
jgi:hypothetical protein